MDRVFYYLEKALQRFWSLNRPIPVAALASSNAEIKQCFNDDLKRIVDDMRFLLGVPKFRTSQPKVRTRKFSHTRIISPVKNLVCCSNCGTYHEAHTICGTCYEQVRKITNRMKEKIMNYNPYIGERQQLPKQEEISKTTSDAVAPNLSKEVWRGKRIVEPKVPQETWFKKIYRSVSNN